ncbi:MAG TPA: hypothetical protein VMU56_04435, partial [Beijerinckiaceae bacterium]|nr:hypothetical protein [Beijerinckiaceae bacterium]
MNRMSGAPSAGQNQQSGTTQQTGQSPQKPGLSEQQKKSVVELSKPEDIKSLSGDDQLLSMYFDFLSEKKYDPKNRTALSFAFKDFHTALRERETRERKLLTDLKTKIDELFDPKAASPYFTSFPQPVLKGLEALLRSPIAAIRNEALPFYSECWRRGTLATNGMDIWLASALE